MKDLLVLLAHLLTTIAKLLGPGSARAIVADSLLMKQQLLVINRSRRRAPNLSALDRFLFGFWSLFLNPRRIQRAAVIIRPSTLLKFHDMLKKRKYRLLYSSGRKGKPGPKGPSRELIEAIVELKRRNTRFGCRRIAQQINKAFELNIDKDVVRRVLKKHYHPHPDDKGPSWLHLSDIPKTVSGALICFVASPFCSRPTGCSWSWTNSGGASLALACTPVMLTVWPCVECSTPPFQPRVFRSISALTTIRYSCITNGKRTYGFLRSRRLRLSPTHRYHIPLLSD